MKLNISKEFSDKLPGKILELRDAVHQLDSIFFKISSDIFREHTMEIDHPTDLSNSLK